MYFIGCYSVFSRLKVIRIKVMRSDKCSKDPSEILLITNTTYLGRRKFQNMINIYVFRLLHIWIVSTSGFRYLVLNKVSLCNKNNNESIFLWDFFGMI